MSDESEQTDSGLRLAHHASLITDHGLKATLKGVAGDGSEDSDGSDGGRNSFPAVITDITVVTAITDGKGTIPLRPLTARRIAIVDAEMEMSDRHRGD